MNGDFLMNLTESSEIFNIDFDMIQHLLGNAVRYHFQLYFAMTTAKFIQSGVISW